MAHNVLDARGNICLPRSAPNVLDGLLLHKYFLSGISRVLNRVPLEDLGEHEFGPFVEFAVCSEQRHLRDRLRGLLAHDERLAWLERELGQRLAVVLVA